MEGKKEPREEVSTSAAQGSLGEAGEAVQRAAGQALSRAGDVADDVLAADRHYRTFLKDSSFGPRPSLLP